MIALLSVGGAARDAALSFGLGFILGFFYCLLRFCISGKRISVFVCDVLIFTVGAVLFRSAAAGMFEGGIMRWYTAFCAVLSYFLCISIFLHKVLKTSKKAKLYLMLPLNYIYNCYFKIIIKAFAGFIIKIYIKIHKICVKIPKKKKRHLQSETKMLYNS